MTTKPGLPDTPLSPALAILFRSAALFVILFQLRLLAGDLADTAVFSVTLCAAFGAAFFLNFFIANGKKIRAPAAVIIIAAIPWIARTFIAIPRLFFPGRADAFTAGLDSLLLNYDRNNFVSLLPFYWAAATTWFAIRSRLFLRAAVIADVVILTAIFGLTGASGMAAYRWPVVLIVLLTWVIFAQALALLFSLPPQLMLRRREEVAAIAVLLILVFLGGIFFLKPSQERASQKGGGLLEPKLFSFDFSQFLRLDTEISMGDDLILIVKKDQYDYHTLLRRSVLSGYNKNQGFYRVEEYDEQTHPQRLPPRPAQLSPAEFDAARRVTQEYYMVNFDSAAFIGMKEPSLIIPYESWDSSSFKSAYSVESLVSDAVPEDMSHSLYDSNGGVFWPGPQELGLTEKEFAMYTNYGGDERIRSYAEEITGGHSGYYDRVEMIFDRLKYGEYRYSLRPGIAPDGDQLSWFLFQSKKGYCSYYAFAMTLLLRSLGIPARVAAGFFLDPETEVFGYHPVRSDMAHAWVEVPFPGCGWIEFDPTTEDLAEGEDFRLSSGVDPLLFERLMREILENRSKLRAKTGQDAANPFADARSLAEFSKVLKKIALPFLLLSLVTAFIIIRCGWLFMSIMRNSWRAQAVCLWKHTRRRLSLAGYRKPSSEGESEWALRCDSAVRGTYSLYHIAAAARFARDFLPGDFISMQGAYRHFSDSYKKTIPLRRRLLAWLFPPLALVLREKPRKGTPAMTLLLLFVFFAAAGGRAQNTDDEYFREADELYSRALDAQYSEYWERAIDLFREGIERYPLDSRFSVSLGNLYYNRSLYGLAWDEYRKAEIINPFSTYILMRLANTASYLNHDKTSVEYLEKLLAIDPENREAIRSLGWMYYKVHRLEEGELLLREALDHFGEDADLSMTMATINAGLYRYDEGKYWYQKSITQAGPIRSFVAVAHYNLSILESRFYHYDLSMNEANASLDSQSRSSGFLARGELNMRRLDIAGALADFEAARESDPSPLAKLNLSQMYLISGRLEEARLYAHDCLNVSDHSWMAHYGIDPIRYKRDVHEILYKTYRGLSQAERFLPWGTFGEKIKSLFRRISCTFYSQVHRKLYQKYSFTAGDAYILADGNAAGISSLPLEQSIQYYNAFEPYPRRALAWLNKAKNFETAIIPAAAASYYLEEGILLKNKNLLARALEELDPLWERELIAQGLREFACRGSRGARRAAAAELFALNRGALLQAGIRLPVDIFLHYSEGSDSAVRRSENRLLRTLAKAGFEPAAEKGTRYRLDIAITGSSAAIELTDGEGELSAIRRTLALRSLSGPDIAVFARALSDMVFYDFR